MTPPAADPTVPKAFISYSWDNRAHKEWVKQLATRLRADGVDVTLDHWGAAPGDQIASFMERAVRESDFVLAICTPRFKERSDGRGGGVGYEGDIITAYAFTGGDQKKFIPVLRRGSWSEAAPTWLLGRAKIDLSEDPYSESEYDELLRTLHGEREKPPPLGHRPSFGDKKESQPSPAPAPETPLTRLCTPQQHSSTIPPANSRKRPMRILLTSFGVNEFIEPGPHEAFQRGFGVQHLAHHAYSSASPTFSFLQMPPVDMREVGDRFVPDYAAILVAEKLLMDEESYDALAERTASPYTLVAEVVKELMTSGFLELVNYRAALQRNADLLRIMLENDLQSVEPWVDPLRESLGIWKEFSTHSMMLTAPRNAVLTHQIGLALRSLSVLTHESTTHENTHPGFEILVRPKVSQECDGLETILTSATARRRARNRESLRRLLNAYLRYVNANLVLAREFNAGFHDWADYLPFYRKKFLGVAQREPEAEDYASQLRKLFSIPFPEFAVRDTKQLMTILEDRRIEELRQLISSAVAGDVVFDEQFAKETLKGALAQSQQTSRCREVSWFLTKPLVKVPFVGPLVKPAANWLASKVDDRSKKGFRWYYMLSDAAK
jgi:hypothetical protein